MSSKFGTNYVTIFFPKGKNQHHLNFTPVVIFLCALANCTPELPHPVSCKREQI